MLRKIDRVVFRVPSLPAAVGYYRDVLGLKLLRQDGRVASFRLADDSAELVLHTDPDLPGEAVYYLVDDVRDLYKRRAQLKLTFTSAPAQAARGYRAAVRDPFGTVLLLLDRSTESAGASAVEDAKAPGLLFAGVEPKVQAKADVLTRLYEGIGRTADDLPYTPHFETPVQGLRREDGRPQADPGRDLAAPVEPAQEGQAAQARRGPQQAAGRGARRTCSSCARCSAPTSASATACRTPTGSTSWWTSSTRRRPRPLSPHLVWRLVATLAK